MKSYRHGSLFSGIGGFDYAASLMGWQNIFNVETDPFCRTVLKHHYPEARQYEDIRKFNASVYKGIIDILTGGFPCQPFSTAGLRRGNRDKRHLWPQMLRVIRECRPQWVIAENVPGLLSISDGMVLRKIFRDLEAEGYEVSAYLIPACSVGAPHRRERLWIVAHANNAGFQRKGTFPKSEGQKGTGSNGRKRSASDTSCVRMERNRKDRKQKLPLRTEKRVSHGKSARAIQAFRLSQSPVCSANDGVSTRLHGLTFSKLRTESIKAYGNAIVPQVALQLFRAISYAVSQNGKGLGQTDAAADRRRRLVLKALAIETAHILSL